MFLWHVIFFSMSRYIDHGRVSGPVIFDHHEEHSSRNCFFCRNVYHCFKSLVTNWNKVCAFVINSFHENIHILLVVTADFYWKIVAIIFCIITASWISISLHLSVTKRCLFCRFCGTIVINAPNILGKPSKHLWL